MAAIGEVALDLSQLKKGVIIDHHRMVPFTKISPLLHLFHISLKDVISYERFNIDPDLSEKLEQYDYIILSGGNEFSANDSNLEKEILFLRRTEKPIIGICLGHQLLPRVFLKSEDFLNNVKRFEDDKRRKIALSYRDSRFSITYDHVWYVSASDVIESEFIVLESKFNSICHYVTIMEHKKKCIFSVQGHPELIIPSSSSLYEKFFADVSDSFFNKTRNEAWKIHFDTLIELSAQRKNIDDAIIKKTTKVIDSLVYSASLRNYKDRYSRSDFFSGQYTIDHFLLRSNGELWAKFGDTQLAIKILKISNLSYNDTPFSVKVNNSQSGTQMRNIEFYIKKFADQYQISNYQIRSIAFTTELAFLLTINGDVFWADRKKRSKDIELIKLDGCSGWTSTKAIFILNNNIYFLEEDYETIYSKKIILDIQGLPENSGSPEKVIIEATDVASVQRFVN